MIHVQNLTIESAEISKFLLTIKRWELNWQFEKIDCFSLWALMGYLIVAYKDRFLPGKRRGDSIWQKALKVRSKPKMQIKC